MVVDCLSCQALRGEILTPGGMIFEDEYWLVDHTLPPVFICGKLTLKLKRHCENLAELTKEETAALGPLIQKVCRALQHVTGARKVHVASYGEGVSQVYFLITPRTADLPASNLYLTLWVLWKRGLYRLGIKKGVYSKEDTRICAERVQEALLA